MKTAFLILISTLITASSAMAASKIICDCGTFVDFGGSMGRSWVSSGVVTIFADPANYHSAAQRACINKTGELNISYRCRLAN